MAVLSPPAALLVAPCTLMPASGLPEKVRLLPVSLVATVPAAARASGVVRMVVGMMW